MLIMLSCYSKLFKHRISPQSFEITFSSYTSRQKDIYVILFRAEKFRLNYVKHIGIHPFKSFSHLKLNCEFKEISDLTQSQFASFISLPSLKTPLLSYRGFLCWLSIVIRETISNKSLLSRFFFKILPWRQLRLRQIDLSAVKNKTDSYKNTKL